MQVKGFEVNMIEAKRFSKQGEKIGNIRIDHNSTVIQITKSAENTACIEFRFTTNYVGMGYIKIEGQVAIVGEVDPVISEWAKASSMSPDVANMVHNTVVPNCIPTALLVARDIHLPPPFPMPRINIQQQPVPGQKKFEGVEVA
jgi:hypothetical protein